MQREEVSLFGTNGQSAALKKVAARNFRILALAALFALFPLLVSSLAHASGPSSNRVLNYQIRLTDSSGIPVANGTKNIKLTFFTAASGGTQLYTACSANGTPTGTPTAVVATFTNGTATVLIGDTTLTCASGTAVAIPATLFDNTAIFLGVTVEADAEMTPRKRIVAAGYALNADKLDDLETSAVGGANAFVPVTDSSGNFTLTQNVTLGDAAADNIVFNADINSHFLPNTDDTFDLGATAQRWRDLYLGPATLHIGTAIGDEGTLTYNTTTNVLNIDSTGTVDINGGSGSTGCSVDASGNFACTGTVTGGGGGGLTGSGAAGQATFWTGASALSGDNNFFWDNTNKRLGIGNAAPSLALDVLATGSAGTARFRNNTNAFASIDIDSGGTSADFSVIRLFDRGTNKWELRKNSANNFDIRDASVPSAPFTIEAGSPTNAIYVRTSTGNVGIGTSTASEKLHVAGNGRFGGITVGDTATNFVNLDTQVDGNVLLSSNLSVNDSNQLVISNSHSTMSGAGVHIPGNGRPRQGTIEFWTTPTAGVTAGNNFAQGSPRVVIDNNGNLGVGDASPAGMLTVGNGDLFQVGSDGDLDRVKNIAYAWPSVQGGASTVLTNDGAGNLSWAAAGPGGTAFVQNGNSFAAAATLGTNDAFALNFETSGTTRMTLDTSGGLTHTYSGTTGSGYALTANSLTTGKGLALTTSSNTANSTAWTANSINITNAQSVSNTGGGTDIGLDVRWTQNPSAGAATNEHIMRLNIAQNDTAASDTSLLSMLEISNSDTATGNQISAATGLRIAGTNIGTGIHFLGSPTGNLIDHSGSSFSVSNAGGVAMTSLNNIGNTTLGDTTSDTISVPGRFTSSLVPATDNTSEIGTFANRWARLHTGNGDSTVGGIVVHADNTDTNKLSIGTFLVASGFRIHTNSAFGLQLGTGTTAGTGIVIDTSNNVTTSADLAVNGGDLTTSAATFNLAASATTLNLAGGSGSTGCTVDGSGNLACSGTVSGGGGSGITGSGAAGQATFWTGAGTVAGDNNFFWDNTNKRLGIGLTGPTAKLEVTAGATAVKINSTAGNTTNVNALVIENAGGADYVKLRNIGSGTGGAELILDGATSGIGKGAWVTFQNSGADNWTVGQDIGAAGDLGFSIVSGAQLTTNTRFYITQAGNVGIGDTSPAATLTVGSGDLFQVAGATGNVTTSGDMAVNGADLTTTAATGNLFNTNATTVNVGGAATTLNLAGGSGSTGCTVDASGNLTCSGTITGSGSSNAFVQNGNSFGTMATLGTNDAFNLAFETAGTAWMNLDTAGNLGFNTAPAVNKGINFFKTIGDGTGDDVGLFIDARKSSADAANLFFGADIFAETSQQQAQVIGIRGRASDNSATSPTSVVGGMFQASSPGAGTPTNAIAIQASASGGTNDYAVQTTAGDVQFQGTIANSFYFDASADAVGIGTASPGDRLEVVGSGTAIRATDGAVVTRLFSSASTSSGYVGTNTNHNFVLRTNGSDKYTIDATGDMFPAGTGQSIIFPAQTGDNTIGEIIMFNGCCDNGRRAIIGHSPGFDDWGLSYDDTNDDFYFATGLTATPDMAINMGSAQIYVGTAVSGSGTAVYRASTGQLSSSQANGVQFDAFGAAGVLLEEAASEGGGFFANGNTSAIWSPGDGNGVFSVYDEDFFSGATPPTPDFRVQPGGIGAFKGLAGGGTTLCYNTGTYAGMNALSNCVSSRKYKENIEPLAVDIDKVMALAPVQFDWKKIHHEATVDANGKPVPAWDEQFSGPSVGLIAEEVAELLPEIVTYKDGQVEGLEYKLLTVYQLAVLKQHHADIEALKRGGVITTSGGMATSDVDAAKVRAEMLIIKNTAAKRTSGTGKIAIGAAGATIENVAVTPTSLINITFKDDPGARWWIGHQENGKFVLSLSSPAAAELDFTYWIVGVQEGQAQ